MRLNIKPEFPFVKDLNGDVREFENSSKAKNYFTEQFSNRTEITATVYVKDEVLEFIHTKPLVKAVKA